MVIAIEPMINMGSYSVEILEDDWTVVTADRRPSAHYEHTVAITRNGPMILTASEGQERFDIKEFSAIIGNKR
jgi:methionyl aminopeptidase